MGRAYRLLVENHERSESLEMYSLDWRIILKRILGVYV
jgi:hypothetical protein